MPNPDLRIPEPTLPEHALIRDAAPLPELSGGLKAKVMSECSATIAQSRKMWRWKVTGAVTAFCALGIVVALSIPDASVHPTEMTEQAPVTPQTYSSGYQMTVDSPAPPPGPDTEKRQMKQLIEDLQGRNQMLDANIIPKF